jgi:hypothetical protein
MFHKSLRVAFMCRLIVSMIRSDCKYSKIHSMLMYSSYAILWPNGRPERNTDHVCADVHEEEKDLFGIIGNRMHEYVCTSKF